MTDEFRRECGDCQLCCRLLPVKELAKPHNTRCTHQRARRGCAVYRRPGFPSGCALWSCVWLVRPEDVPGVKRPDHAGYVIDIMPDIIVMLDDDGTKHEVTVTQVWIDPARPGAEHDPALKAFIEREAENDRATLLRLAGDRAKAVFAPRLTYDDKWHTVESTTTPGFGILSKLGAEEILTALTGTMKPCGAEPTSRKIRAP